jgi:hypothetical protein
VRSSPAGRLLLILLAVASASSACGGPTGADRSPGDTGPPWCDDFSVLVLAAQSVPDARFIPCIEATPIGWTVNVAHIDDEGMRFTLDSKIAGDDAARAELSPDCDPSEHVEVPSDIAGTSRFEFVESIESGVKGQRIYEFEGGCVTIDIDLEVDVSAALINEVSLALGFVTRAEVNDAVRSATDGREQVDPPDGR